MATIKSYTSLEQSKKLAKILPIESADMMWKKELKYRLYSDEHKVCESDFIYFPIFRDEKVMISNFDIPCWSLAMLFEIIADVAANIDEDGFLDATVCKDVHSILLVNCNGEQAKADTLIDACYEMILSLKDKNLL